MGSDNVHLVADFLRVFAVLAGVIEFLDQRRRSAIESWLAGTLPRILGGIAITLAVLYVTVLLLVSFGPWLVIVFFLFGRVINFLVAKAVGDDSVQWGCMGVGFAVLIVAAIAAVLEKWVIPESWILALAYPYEAFSVWANSNWLVDWLLPDFTAEGFLSHYREVFKATEDWLWDWLASVNALYFFFARGFMLVMVALIQGAFLLSIVLGAILIPLGPLYCMMKLSEYLKRLLGFAIPDRLPVMGLLFVALGEVLDLVLDVMKVVA